MSIDDGQMCPMCGNTGLVYYEVEVLMEYVSKDMAMDAGIPDMEGMPLMSTQEDVDFCTCRYGITLKKEAENETNSGS